MPASCACEGVGLRAALREDLDRYIYRVQQGGSGSLAGLVTGLLTQGLWATTAYRLNHHAKYCHSSRLFGVVASVVHRAVMMATGIHIHPRAHLGPGVKIAHSAQILIGSVRMGANCDIYQGVTLGLSESTLSLHTHRADVPTLGDRVWVGPGAVVAGGVTIGDDVMIGANSLLVRDAPARGVMIGVPARMVSRRGSFTQVSYRTLECDDERKLALAELENDADLAR